MENFGLYTGVAGPSASRQNGNQTINAKQNIKTAFGRGLIDALRNLSKKDPVSSSYFFDSNATKIVKDLNLSTAGLTPPNEAFHVSLVSTMRTLQQSYASVGGRELSDIVKDESLANVGLLNMFVSLSKEAGALPDMLGRLLRDLSDGSVVLEEFTRFSSNARPLSGGGAAKFESKAVNVVNKDVQKVGDIDKWFDKYSAEIAEPVMKDMKERLMELLSTLFSTVRKPADEAGVRPFHSLVLQAVMLAGWPFYFVRDDIYRGKAKRRKKSKTLKELIEELEWFGVETKLLSEVSSEVGTMRFSKILSCISRLVVTLGVLGEQLGKEFFDLLDDLVDEQGSNVINS